MCPVQPLHKGMTTDFYYPMLVFVIAQHRVVRLATEVAFPNRATMRRTFADLIIQSLEPNLEKNCAYDFVQMCIEDRTVC
ncbi:hypothetical protein DYBT9623_05294 [Dyadobacter sp. CECT 9623]|uniref:Uncharacterized protein n=1 Tax=Dyadobacter linearis TaxID=2823330 RepID=A0ABN7REP5_9BACT|nr:hypothetical protein DYBT9623_05294 [Dyadobacter sp. CECT 9623]